MAATKYDLHIEVPNEMRSKLKDLAELAFYLELTPKPDLVDLICFFIEYGKIIVT